MGGASSTFKSCTSSKKKKKSKKNIKEPTEKLTDDLDGYQGRVHDLRSKGSELTKKVNPRDKELIEEKLKGREKKLGNVRSRTARASEGYTVVEGDLADVEARADQYLAWLASKADQVQLTRPEGYKVRDTQNKLDYIHNVCTELENRQATLEAVAKKVESILPDLTPADRDKMEASLQKLHVEHQRVYEAAVAQKDALAEAVNAREVYHAGLERVTLWLQDRERRAAKLEKHRLAAVEVEKQADKAKTLCAEIEKYRPNIEQIDTRVQALQHDCSAEAAVELEQKSHDIQSKFSELKAHANSVHENLRLSLAARKKHESDLQKVQRWCKDTEMKCAADLSLDCATEVLQEQHKQYKNLHNGGQMFDSLLKELHGRAETFLPNLSEADTLVLKQQTKSAQDKFDRICGVVEWRLKTLEEALHTRDQVGEGTQDAAQWLADLQDELRKLPRSIGPSVVEAENNLKQYENVAEKMSNYEPTMAQLNQAVDRLRSLGQHSEAEEIQRLITQYDMLGDQVQQQVRRCQQAVGARQQLDREIKDINKTMKECEATANSVIGQNVPFQEKIQTLRDVSAKLQSISPAVFTMGDHAQRIGIEATGDDARAVMATVEDVKDRVDNLKKISERKIRQCEAIQKDRENFEGAVDETINWLDTKEDLLASCGSLDLDPHKVNTALQKHQTLSKDALDKLGTVREKARVEQTHYETVEEPIPEQLSEKLEQINSLEDSIKGAISKKEQYLLEAASDRHQLETSMRQIHDWIHGAEDMLDSGYEGLDYDTLNDTISEHRDYFSEASMCQDEMDQVMELSERLLPTLDVNDTETLRQSLKNTGQKLANVTATSHRKQQELAAKFDDWQEYQEMALRVNEDLQLLEEDWAVEDAVSLVNISSIHKHLLHTKEFIEKVDSFRSVIDELNERSHDLSKDGTGKSRQLINECTSNVNDRWKHLVGSTENNQMTLQDLEAQYEDYSALLQAADDALDEAENKCPEPVDLDSAQCPELVAQLDQTQALMEVLEAAEPRVVALRKCAQQFQAALPTAEAKLQSQEIVMAMMEKFRRLSDAAKDQVQVLQEEIDDREGFHSEANQTMDWLTETRTQLHELATPREIPDVMEKIDRLKVSEQEIAVRMGQMRQMAQLQEAKFKSQGRGVPRELQARIEQMVVLEGDVTTTMAGKGVELLQLKADRETYKAELEAVGAWLTQAQAHLLDKVIDVPESLEKHKKFLGEFDEFKERLDKLRTSGGELLKRTSDPIEKTTIQKALGDKSKQWLSLQAKAGQKTRELQEADRVDGDFGETADAIDRWLQQTRSVLNTKPAWTDINKVREQLKQYKRLLKDSEQQQNKLSQLNALISHMEPLCETAPNMERLGDLSHKVFDMRAQTIDKIGELEDVNDQIAEFELELMDLKQWMEKTRAHLTLRDDSITLKDQLKMQENLINDIEKHKGKALYVLKKHAELHAAVGEESPLHNTKLALEINALLLQAREDYAELTEAVSQQQQYETEIRQLTQSMTDAQEELLGSPIQANSVEALKQQISERNELAQKIRANQARVNELTEKSHNLVARSASLGPLLARRLYHIGGQNTTLADLIDTLSAPLEPYISPLPSPRSPEGSARYRYENPLRLFKGDIEPVSPDTLESGYKSTDPTMDDSTDFSQHETKTLSAYKISTPAGKRADPSVTVDRTSGKKPLDSVESIAFPKTDKLSIKIDPLFSKHQVVLSSTVLTPPQKTSSTRSYSSDRESVGDTTSKNKPLHSVDSISFPKTDKLNIKTDPLLSKKHDVLSSTDMTTPQKTPSKRSYSSDRESVELPSKTVRQTDDKSTRTASVKSGSTEEPLSSELDMSIASSLSSHPYSHDKSGTANQMYSWRQPLFDLPIKTQVVSEGEESSPKDVTGQGQGSEMNENIESKNAANLSTLPKDMLSLKERKEAALTPYQFKSNALRQSSGDKDKDKQETGEKFKSLVGDLNYLLEPDKESSAEQPTAAKDSSKTWRTKHERATSSKGPVKASHGQLSGTDSDKDQLGDQIDKMLGRKSRSESTELTAKGEKKRYHSSPWSYLPSITVDDEGPLKWSMAGSSRSPSSSPDRIRGSLLAAGGRDMDLSRSVPSLLDSPLHGVRDRSSSFGSRTKYTGFVQSPFTSRSGSRSSKFDELSSSWQNLQKQLGTKERELQVAIQKQERYQSSVQDVTGRMERMQQGLMSLAPAPYKDMEKQLKDHREMEQEIESIRDDIARVKERGRRIMESSDPEGYQAMQATLSMLTDKIDNLQSMSDDKAKQLQNVMKDKEKHKIALSAYRKQVKEIEDWMDEVKVRQAATPLPTDSVDMLQQQLLENRELQGELNQRLQQVADLAIHCDRLCEMEDSSSADMLRSQLAAMQQSLGNLKLGAIEKQAPLRSAIKESEKRKREMDDYESNVKNLQKWISDTKKMAGEPDSIEQLTISPMEKQQLQQQLESDLFQHRNLVRQLSSEVRTRDSREARPARSTMCVMGPLREEDMQPRWEQLSKALEQKKRNLEDSINNATDVIGSGKFGKRHYGPDTSSQLQDIRRHLSSLKDLWKQLAVQVDDKQLRLDQALDFQQRYQEALQNVSGWLDLAEHKLFAPDANLTSQERVQENEDLQREIKSLQGEIAAMGHSSQELLAVTNADSHELIRQSLGNLNDRVRILEHRAKEEGDKLRSVDRHYKQYQDEVRNLEAKLGETHEMMGTPGPSAPLSLRMETMKKIEAQMKKCESHLEDVKKHSSELSALDPEIISPHEVDSLQTNYMDLQRKVLEKKASLQQSVSIQEQYEKLLHDYADFLETAEEKLRNEAIAVKDLPHLRQQLSSHKDFFSDLEVHRAMLDSLVAQCDKATKQKHLPAHTRLSNLTYVLQDKASLHGQRLDRLVRHWGDMEEKFEQLQRFLDDVESQIPKPISNDDSLAVIQSKINTYQRLQRELNDEKPTVFQVVDKGKQLLHSINCPTLEMLITDLADKWVDLNTDLSHELKRSEAVGEHLQVFEAEAAVLRSWLTTANSKLSAIKQLSAADLRSIATVRSKIDKLLEFRKEVENQQPLKEKVLSIGNQLLQNQVYQTSDLEPRMAFLESEWGRLERDTTAAEGYLHQAQMDLMPSRQALGELNAWLHEIEETLDAERQRSMKSLADMEVLLKKYKSYKIDLSSKQLTVDFVNQDVLQPKEETDSALPAERNEFSERLGTLNGRWKDVSRHVSDRLKTLESIHDKWEEFEKSVTRLIGWFHDQEDKLTKYRLIGHEVSVRQTLKDSKAMVQTLKVKQIELNYLKELGDSLIELSQNAEGCKESIHTSLSNIATRKQNLERQLDEVQRLLEDVLAQWDSYHSELQVVSQVLAETEYCLQRYNLIGGDIATLKIQVEKLEHLLTDMDRHIPRHDKFNALAVRLSQVCEAPTRQEVHKCQSDIESRWQSVHSELRSQTEKFRKCLQRWLMYEEEYNQARSWLDAKEALCDELLYGKEPTVRGDANLVNCQALQSDLDNFQSKLSNLYKVGDDVTKHMDPDSIVNITSKLSGLEQRVLTIRQKLIKHIQSLQGDLSHQRRFQEAFDNVKAFVSQAERILGMEDPGKTADEKVLNKRLEHLKELCDQFSEHATQLDGLNDLGYRLALNATAAAELQDLNHKWHELYSETKERCKMLQGMLLVQQDFAEKCDTWMMFLGQTETDLSTEIAGNLIDLMTQQRKCEKFEAEMYSRQQILHAIISDGQTMMSSGDIDDKEEFQQKLHMLADQWQSVVRRANQRKAIIDNTIKQWQLFNDLSEKLRDWLQDKEDGLEVFTFDTASLQKVKNLVERAKNTQNEFKLQEDLFRNMNSQGKQLVQRADDKAEEELKVCMAQLQQHWHQIFVRLDSERARLEAVLRRWDQCEEDIEDTLTWLKDTKKTLASPLPTAYDQLQADMHKCKDIGTAFANSESKRQSLLANEKELAKVIDPEDLNVLHQRIRLMNKQWDELRNQASIRSQRIDDTMFRWSNFSEKLKELCEWIDGMEVRVISSKDYHIEDLLTRIQKDFKEEMAEREKAKYDLVEQGVALMKISSEVRASDIEQKIMRLDDKWQHLKAVIGFRERKLQETLLAVQQLDVSMSNLRQWLATMEAGLAAPTAYSDCDRKEIQKKLQRQTDLQHDIERHSPGVGSVLNLCEVLLHDSDACPTEVEFNGLQTAMKNLERRWRSICQISPEQRLRIEETWKLWQTLIDDCRLFTDWLKTMETDVSNAATPEQPNISVTREEYRRCEGVQKKIHENLRKLELINKQYRRLAREGRTDTGGTLKAMMQDANDRWDRLQSQMAGVLKDLKHSTSVREDFKRTKDSLLGWLTEIEMQLTNIEHLTSMDVPTKLREMQRIQDEIDGRVGKFDYLDDVGLYLVQKGDSAEAITTQAELDTFRQYHRKVMDKVAMTNARLAVRQSEERCHLNDDELDRLERELYALAPDEPLSLDWSMKDIEAYLESSPPDSPPEKRRALLQKLRARSRSRSRSPVKLTSVTSAGLVTPTKARSPVRSRLRTKSPRRVAQDYVDRAHSPSRQERYDRMRDELSHRGQEAKVEDILERLADALETAANNLHMAERELHTHTPTGPSVDRVSMDYLQSMRDAERSVEDVRRIERLLKAQTGLQNIASADAQVRSVLQQWEMLQASAIQKDFRLGQHRKSWGQFRTDLDNMHAWLDEAEALQRSHKPLPGEITRLDTIIRQHKDFLVQLESKKTRVLSINLTSKELIDVTTEEGRELRDRLSLMNKRWDATCSSATRLQTELQVALMQCQEFHHTIHDMLLWLEGIETKIQQCEPINIINDQAGLWSRLRKLQDIKFDLEKNQPRVMSLRDTADQLLINSDSPEMSNAKDKMHIIANRLKALHRLCSSYITSLESRLDSKHSSPHSSSLDLSGSLLSDPSSPRGGRTSTPTRSRPLTHLRPASSNTRIRPRSPFAISRQLIPGMLRPCSVGSASAGRGSETSIEQHDGRRAALIARVCRMALPLQLLLLLLLAVASIVPMTEDDYNCILANNLRRSLDPMLQYTDGPPPV